MNKELTNNYSYLLEASFEVLHEECREWLSDIEFWKNEVNFFSKLLSNNYVKSVLEGKKEIYDTATSKLKNYKEKTLEGLKNNVLDQDKFLSGILQDMHSSEDSVYRGRHKELAIQISTFKKEYQEIKKDFFRIMENWP